MLLKITWGVLFAGLSFLSMRAVLRAGPWEKVFEDMLGDSNKLPQITKLFLAWSNAGGSVLAPAVIGGVITAGFLSMVAIRNLRVAGAACGLCSFLLLSHWLVGRAAIWAPLSEVLKGLSGGDVP